MLSLKLGWVCDFDFGSDTKTTNNGELLRWTTRQYTREDITFLLSIWRDWYLWQFLLSSTDKLPRKLAGRWSLLKFSLNSYWLQSTASLWRLPRIYVFEWLCFFISQPRRVLFLHLHSWRLLKLWIKRFSLQNLGILLNEVLIRNLPIVYDVFWCQFGEWLKNVTRRVIFTEVVVVA